MCSAEEQHAMLMRIAELEQENTGLKMELAMCRYGLNNLHNEAKKSRDRLYYERWMNEELRKSNQELLESDRTRGSGSH
jgi:hypothetical protein